MDFAHGKYDTSEIPEDSVSHFSGEGKYKSVSLDRPLPRTALKNSAVSKDTLSACGKSGSNLKSSCDKVPENLHCYVAPGKPTLLLMHNFCAIENGSYIQIEEVVQRIESVVQARVEISYEFVKEECMWNIAYLRGSSSYKSQIHIYQDNVGFIVEVHRLSGDAFPFHALFNEVKDAVTNAPPSCGQESFMNIFPLPEIIPISDEETIQALQPIVDMAYDRFMEPKVEAAKVLCDLSQHEGMHQALLAAKCIEAMVHLVSSGVEGAAQHAVLALANISASQSCQETIINAGVLPNLLALITNRPYHSAVMGREGARLLANLSDRLAARVIVALGEKEIKSWMNSVDSLDDTFLKQQALRARGYLSSFIDPVIDSDTMLKMQS
eukprot:gene13653-29013_t